MYNAQLTSTKKIAVIGQGYVGLPLAVELAHHFPVVGFDIDIERIRELKNGIDRTHEADTSRLCAVLGVDRKVGEHLEPLDTPTFRSEQRRNSEIAACSNKLTGLSFSSEIADIRSANIYIVTVPTPIDDRNVPDLNPLRTASKMLGELLKKGDIVVYESTVYPGCTEEDCVPLLEKISGLTYNDDFYVGYSPERINPGDKVNTLTKIKKVTSGSTPEIADEIDAIYKTIIKAGTFKAASIKVAEASKAIENAQRDVNISFMNEVALIFDRMGIDTSDVLEAAGTKFNFLKYRPGLVGGHCISVDPYYLTHKATQLGYHPEVILSGRRVNNSIPSFIASKVVKLMASKDIPIRDSEALILGFTFKENCPDIRNTKVIDIYNELIEYGIDVSIYDPWADSNEVYREFGIHILTDIKDIYGNKGDINKYDALILAIAHDKFLKINLDQIMKRSRVVFDAKSILPRALVDARL